MFIHVVLFQNGDMYPTCYILESFAKKRAQKIGGTYYTLRLSFKGMTVQ